MTNITSDGCFMIAGEPNIKVYYFQKIPPIVDSVTPKLDKMISNHNKIMDEGMVDDPNVMTMLVNMNRTTHAIKSYLYGFNFKYIRGRIKQELKDLLFWIKVVSRNEDLPVLDENVKLIKEISDAIGGDK